MKTNNQRGRIEIIDYELSRKSYISTKDLIKSIEEKLDVTFNARTIQKDIELMKRDAPIGYNAPIKFNPSKKAWYYENPGQLRLELYSATSLIKNIMFAICKLLFSMFVICKL